MFLFGRSTGQTAARGHLIPLSSKALLAAAMIALDATTAGTLAAGTLAGGASAQESQLPHGTLAAPPSHGAVQFQVGQRNVKSLYADRDSVWVGTSGGLIHYDPARDRYQRYDNTTGLLSNGIFYVGKIRGEIWVGTYGGGLSVLNPEQATWRNYNIPHGLGDAFIYDALEASNGDIWIATWSGVNRVIGGAMDDVEAWRLHTVESTSGGLPNDWVYGLAEGKNGVIWLATEGGLARFDSGRWDNWNHAQGLGAPYDLVKDAMPFRNDPGEVSSHHARQKAEQGLGDIEVAYNPNYIISLEVDRDGQVWAGTWGGGLSRFDGQTWTTLTVADGLPGNHIFALGRDGDDALWIGTSRGIARYQDGSFSYLSREQGLYSDIVFSIEFAEDGAAWFGSLGGVTWFPKGPAEAAVKG